MESPRIDEMMTDQQVSSDPFAIARSMNEKQAKSTLFEDLVGSTPFDISSPGPESSPAPSSSPMSSLFTGSEQEVLDFNKSALPGALAKLGISNQGLAFNKLGRVQLVGRLQNKFGGNINENPQILDILSQFDEMLKKQDSESANSEMKAMNDRGKRTLAALFKPGG